MRPQPQLVLRGQLTADSERGLSPGDHDLGNELGIDPVAARLLRARGISEPSQARDWLRPRLASLPSPAAMADFSRAVELLVGAVRERATVGIFGDYDVDGVSSAAVLSTYLQLLGVETITEVASRGAGYGFTPDAARRCLERGVQLLVTVDCGTSDHEAIEVLRDAGVATIVVDHHQVPEGESPAAALINPHRDDCEFPFQHLCSVGVAFYLCSGLRTRLVAENLVEGRGPDPRDLLDLVALGTICDMVPLEGVNRVLVHHGLLRLAQTRRPGLLELFQTTKIKADRGIESSRVGFQLGPRLNAPGRLGSAQAALDLLTCSCPTQAKVFASRVEAANQERRGWQTRIVQAALAMVGDRETARARAGWVVADRSWLPGVVGIAAARIVRELDRPTLVIGVDPESGQARGSARSCRGIDVHAALERCSDLLDRFGGHPAAAGVSLPWERVDALKIAFAQAVDLQAKAQGIESGGQDEVEFDLEIAPEQFDRPRVSAVAELGPYGVGFPTAAFVSPPVRVLGVRVFAGEHLSISFEDSGRQLDAIAFSMLDPSQDFAPQSLIGRWLRFVYVPEFNDFRGVRRIQFRIERLWFVAQPE